MDRTFRDVRDAEDKLFGGVTMVAGGDPQQILPVVPKGSREDIVSACLLKSHLWAHAKIHTLRQNMRLQMSSSDEEREFAQWLLDVGHGRNNVMDAEGYVTLPPHLPCHTETSLIDFIYPGLSPHQPIPPAHYFQERLILAPRNDEVENLNTTILNRLPGEEQTYLSADRVVQEPGTVEDDSDQWRYPPEYLRSLNASGLSLGELRVKDGCPLIILRNLSPARGVCNGTRAILLRSSRRVLEVKVLGGEHDGEVVLIPRIRLKPSNAHAEFSFILERLQFPVRLAFAITINKSQGQTAKWVGLDLRSSVFAHGQLYVALSRATSSRRIKVLLDSTDLDNQSDTGTPPLPNSRTKNIVYPEVLLD